MVEKRKGAFLNQLFNPADYKTIGVTERDVELYKEVFDLLDINEAGNLTPGDLRQAMNMFGYQIKTPQVYKMISEYDANESGGIEFKEFLRIMTDQLRPCDEDVEENYLRTFDYFDRDEKGYITKDDILAICLEIKEQMPDWEIEEVMKQLDPENEGKVTFKAFHKMMVDAVARKPKNKK